MEYIIYNEYTMIITIFINKYSMIIIYITQQSYRNTLIYARKCLKVLVKEHCILLREMSICL